VLEESRKPQVKMKKYLSRKYSIGLVIVLVSMLSLSSCSEDIINPDSSAMPPKNTIKTPPQKD
jgi:hypothetical protein